MVTTLLSSIPTLASTGYSQAPTQSLANCQNLFNDLNMCSAVEKYLVSPCSTYVDYNGVLSIEGQRAKGCISNGIMLTGAGLISHVPVEMIVGILKPSRPMILPRTHGSVVIHKKKFLISFLVHVK